MELQSADLTAIERPASGEERVSVPKWDVAAPQPIERVMTDELPQPAKLDLARKLMLGVAGVLTLLWLSALAWGAARLFAALIF
jgi:hypothetical protein